MKKNKVLYKCILSIVFAVVVLAMAAGLGSVRITPGEILGVIANKLFARPLPEGLAPSMVSIIWDIRLPRACSAFIVGAMLSVSGAIVQALLQNPLASSYTLGVSSGASLGAAIIIVNEITIPVIGTLLLPVTEQVVVGLMVIFPLWEDCMEAPIIPPVLVAPFITIFVPVNLYSTFPEAWAFSVYPIIPPV